MNVESIPKFSCPGAKLWAKVPDHANKLRLTMLRSPESPRNVSQIAFYLLSIGARLNEALQAKWCQIDRQTRVWQIPAAVSKSGKIRVVPLNDSALEILGQLETEGKFDYLFVNTRISKKTGEEVGTGKPYTSIMRVWTRLRKMAGLPHFRIHDLRHQYASFLVNSSRTLYEVQQVLGHSDPKSPSAMPTCQPSHCRMQPTVHRS
jgi:integrase